MKRSYYRVLGLFMLGLPLFLYSCNGNDDPEINNKNIRFVDINPDIVLDPEIGEDTEEIELDIDSDGRMDVLIFVDIDDDYVGAFFDFWFPHLQSSVCPFSFIVANDEIALALDKDDIIGSDSNWSSYEECGALLGELDSNSSSLSIGDFIGKESSYLGLRYRDNTGQTFYGWFKLSLSNDISKLTIYEYALNLTPGESIRSGEK